MRGRFPLALATAVVLGALALPAPAAAGRSNGEPCSSPTLTGPSMAYVGDTYTVDGCGFAPLAVVPLELAEADGCCIALNMIADAYGRFSYSSAVWAAGTYRARAAVPRNHTRWRIAASWSFEAYP